MSDAPNVLIAMRAAQQQGSRVLVDDATSSTSETWANPDGTLSSRIAAGPVRFNQNGTWTDIDTTLVANQDGSLSPTAFSDSVVLSGGGGSAGQAQDLLTVGSGKKSIGWQWTGALPVPTVSGNRATYADVKPGVDLVVEVRPTGVEEYFVLTQAPTAAVSFDLPLDLGANVTASIDNSGTVSYTANDGTVLATTPPSSMWSAPTVTDAATPVSSPQPLTVTLDNSGATPVLTVTPSLSYLQDPDTSYPVVLDPGVNLSSTYDTWVNAGSTGFSGGTATTDSIGPLSGSATRSFYDWNDSAILGTDVTAATLYLYNNSADTTANTWQIWRTGLASSSTTWSNQPSWTANDETTTASNGSSAGWVSTSVLTTAQAWAGGSASSVGMGLRTSPETGSVNQMTFSSINGSGNYPYISVTYDDYPNTPEHLVVKNLHVFSSTDYTNTVIPTFSTYVTDPDGGTEHAAYTLTNTTTSTTVLNKALGSSTVNDGLSSYTVSGGSPLIDGDSYQLQVWGWDGTAYSLASKTTNFTIDATAPATPTIASSTYTSGAWTNSFTGGFTFTSSSSDVQVWYYQFNGGAMTPSAAGTCTTTCTYSPTLTPPAGWDTLTVWAADEDGNISSSASFTFGADQAGVTSPTADQVVSNNPNVPLAGNVPLDATGPYAATQVEFDYELVGTDTSWSPIPAANVTNNGTTISGWPVATDQISGGLIAKAPQLSGGGPALSWNVAATLAGRSDVQPSQPIDVRAKFTTTGSTWDSIKAVMTYQTEAMGDGSASVQVGPCSVSLWSGSCEIDASDFGVAGPNGSGLGIDRSFVSNSLPSSGPFGPGWTTSLPTDASDVTSLTDTGGLVTVQGPDTTVTFTPSGSSYLLADGETGTQTLTKSGTGSSTTFTYAEPDGSDGSGNQQDTQQITFTEASQPAGGPSLADPWTYNAATIEPTGPDDTTDASQVTYSATTGYPTQMLASQPSGATCDTTWAVGCEALNFTYNSNHEITAATLETANSSGTPVYTDVACYSYSGSLKLLEEWDPRSVSSTCNYSATVLATTYAYGSTGRVYQVTPPGLATWHIDYNSTTNQVNDVYRTHSSTYGGATQETAFVYNAPIGATTSVNHPDLSAATAAGWGQYDDPVTATAVFGPGTTKSSTDLRASTVYGLDASGFEVDVAGFDGTTQAGWDVDTIQYDQYGNEVSELTPEDRVWVTADSCSEAGLASGCPQLVLADALSTVYDYDSTGTYLMHIYGPTSTAIITGGVQTAARPDTQYTYGTVNYPTVDPSDYSTGGPIGDIVQELDATSEGAASVVTNETDQRTITYAYGLTSSDPAGWDYGTPESTTTTMASGPNIVSQTVINDTTGQTSQVRQPSAAGTSASPATTTFTYYTAGTKNIANCVNSAWVGQLCTTGPGAQPTGESGMAGLPVIQVTSYDYLLRPITTVSTVTDSGGTQRTETTTVSFENGGIANEELSTSTTGGLGTSIPTQTFYYDPNTDLPTVESNTSASSCSSTGPLCATYDDFGNQISFTDTSGATTTTAPTMNDEPATVTLKTPGGSTIQTASYTYAAGNEYRDLPTSLTYTGGTGYSSVGTYTASYNPDGLLTSETLPDGTGMTQTEDPQGNILDRTYDNTSTLLYSEAEYSYDGHDQIAEATRPDIENSVDYTYDNDGRLTKAQDYYYNGQCTTRAYTLDVDSNRTAENTYPPLSGGGCTTSTTPTTQTLTYDSSDRLTSAGSASGIAYDAFGRITTVPAGLVTGGGNETIGYYTDDLTNTLAQGGTTETWTLDPANRYYQSTQTSSSNAITNHYSDFSSDSPSWSSLTNSSSVTSTAVNDPDLTGELAAITNDTSSATAISYQLTDPQGNVLGTANPADPDEVVTPIVTDEFGNLTTISGAPTTGPRYGWLGGAQRDAGNIGGVILMGARDYIPSVGRFLSVDPILGGNDGPYVYPADPVNDRDTTGAIKFGKWISSWSYHWTKYYEAHIWYRASVTVNLTFTDWGTGAVLVVAGLATAIVSLLAVILPEALLPEGAVVGQVLAYVGLIEAVASAAALVGEDLHLWIHYEYFPLLPQGLNLVLIIIPTAVS